MPLASQLLPGKVGAMRPSEVPPGVKIGGILWTFAQLADFGRLSANASLLAVELLDRLPVEIPSSTDRSVLFVDLECLLLALACMASEGAVARQTELVNMLHQRCKLYQGRNLTKLLARAWLGANRGRKMDTVLHSLVGDNFELMLAGGVEKDEAALAAEGRALAGFIQDYYPDQVQTQCMIYLRHGLFGELGSLRFAHVQETIR